MDNQDFIQEYVNTLNEEIANSTKEKVIFRAQISQLTKENEILRKNAEEAIIESNKAHEERSKILEDRRNYQFEIDQQNETIFKLRDDLESYKKLASTLQTQIDEFKPKRKRTVVQE